jgi:TIR domain
MKTKGIFLSHSSRDNPFARKLADDLRAAGLTVWVDEAEIQIGDSLIAKLESGIEDMEYLAVVLSPDSVSSEWVKREVAMALTDEIGSRRVKVLPLLYRDCLLPGFLRDKKYADFRKPQSTNPLSIDSLRCSESNCQQTCLLHPKRSKMHLRMMLWKI